MLRQRSLLPDGIVDLIVVHGVGAPTGTPRQVETVGGLQKLTFLNHCLHHSGSTQM
jgi:hypothetical protein